MKNLALPLALILATSCRANWDVYICEQQCIWVDRGAATYQDETDCLCTSEFRAIVTYPPNTSPNEAIATGMWMVINELEDTDNKWKVNYELAPMLITYYHDVQNHKLYIQGRMHRDY